MQEFVQISVHVRFMHRPLGESAKGHFTKGSSNWGESRLWVYTLSSLHIFESNLFESTLFSVWIASVYTFLSLPYLGLHFFESNFFESTLIWVYLFESTRNNTERGLFLVYTFSVYIYLSLLYYSLHLFESILHDLGLNLVNRILSLLNLKSVTRM